VDVLIEQLRVLCFAVQFLQRGFESLGLAIGCGPFAVGLRLFGLSLFVLAHGFIQLFQAFMQRGKEGVKSFAQLMLRLVLPIHRFFAGVVRQVLFIMDLEFVEARPLLHKFSYSLLPRCIVEHFEQLNGDRFHTRLVLSKPFRARSEIAVNKLHELLPATFVKLADNR